MSDFKELEHRVRVLEGMIASLPSLTARQIQDSLDAGPRMTATEALRNFAEGVDRAIRQRGIAQRCPVCEGRGGLAINTTTTPWPSFPDVKMAVERGHACHGCGGKGWVAA